MSKNDNAYENGLIFSTLNTLGNSTHLMAFASLKQHALLCSPMEISFVKIVDVTNRKVIGINRS